MSSPTGMPTEAWIGLRALQLALVAITFITGCIEQARWPLVLGLLLPNLLLAVLTLLDSVIYYKLRYAQGAGRLSTLRWVMELLILCLMTAALPLILLIPACYPYTDGLGPFYGAPTFTFVMVGFASISIILYLATFIMLCVEDTRMRRWSRFPPLTAPRPDCHPAYRQVSPPPGHGISMLGAEKALLLVNNMIANGFTVQHLEKMGAPTLSDLFKGERRELDPNPPSYMNV